jgi:hypothetical protein
MAYSRIGFHIAANCGGCQGIREFWQAQADAGIPLAVYSVNDAGQLVDALAIDPDAELVYRDVEASTLEPVSYDRLPATEAQVYWDFTVALLPDWVRDNRDRVWIDILNEPGKEGGQANWVGWFSFYTAQLALAQGYKVLSAGWSGGTPEPEHWYTPGWSAYLRLCEQYPERAGISLHEYSFSNDIHEGEGWLIDRLAFLLEACDEQGIDHPPIFITECGWTLNSMPPEGQAKADIAYLAALYAKYPTVKGVFLWTLQEGKGNGDLPERLNDLMPWLAWYNTAARFPDPEPPPGDSNVYLAIVIKCPQDITEYELLQVAKVAHANLRDITCSKDSALNLLKMSGNKESYIQLAFPNRDHEDFLAMLAEAGYRWEALEIPGDILPPFTV